MKGISVAYFSTVDILTVVMLEKYLGDNTENTEAANGEAAQHKFFFLKKWELVD